MIRKQTELFAQIGFYASLGFILPVSVVAGYMLGWLADRWLRTSPVLAVVLAFAGAAGGFVEVLRLLQRAEKSAERDDTHDGPGSS